MVDAFWNLGAGTSFIIALIMGSMMFWWLLQHEVVFNPTLYGYFIQWATCIGGVFIALLLLVGVVGSVIGWIADFIGDHYKLLLGVVVAIIGLGAYSGKNKKETSANTVANGLEPKEQPEDILNESAKREISSIENKDSQQVEPVGNQYCQHCGAKINSADRFCGNCGSSLQ